MKLKQDHQASFEDSTFTHNGITAFASGPFSNFYPCQIVYETVQGNTHIYDSSEQYYMMMKALFFDDHASADKIAAARHPAEAKKLGRKIKGFDEEAWSAVAKQIMFAVLSGKFIQNPELMELLLSTGDNTIAEAAYWDKRWGTGTSIDDPRTYDKTQWLGTNWLGEQLSNLRKMVRTMRQDGGHPIPDGW